jgi:myosin heavy subunit
MFGWIFGKNNKKLEEETKNSFSNVKKDMEGLGTWIKHLDGQDKQLFDMIFELKQEISSIKDEVEGIREGLEIETDGAKNKQAFKKMAVLNKQTAVEDVQDAVQTPVQTGNFYEILKGLSSNERLVIFTLLNAEEGMKLSYEDIALLLGKERATIRGQINSIKQRVPGLIEEITEKNGKKRVFVRAELKEKLSKYAKVRVKGGKGSG